MSKQLLNMVIKNADAVNDYIKKKELQKDKAIKTAIKVESFRIKKVISQGLKKGEIDGSKLEERKTIARRRDNKWGNKKPLRGMASSITYDFDSVKNISRIGWTKKSPQRTRWLANRYQKGFNTTVTTGMRKRFANIGAELPKNSRLRKYFFISKDTTTMKTPERQIIGPVFESERLNIKKNIARNFKIKMSGGRI